MLAIGNLLRYGCAKNYQIELGPTKLLQKVKWCSFFDSHASVRCSDERRSCNNIV